MIVLLRDPAADQVTSRGQLALHASTIRAAHAPFVDQLQSTKARTIQSFQTVNGFATKLSDAEIDTLSARSDVLAVVPDGVIQLPKRLRDTAGGAAKSGGGAAPSSTDGLCNTLEPEALQATHTAFLDPNVPQAQELVDGNGAKVTGAGVTVAFLADGIDPNVPGFIRPDGTNVFVDYQDFSGDPAGTPTAGAEAFGDASSIAAQDVSSGKTLTYDIAKFVNPAHALPSPCTIRVRGVAPGASLVGLKAFSALGFTTNSGFVEAIEWAVLHDHVDVINESFGNNGVYDAGTDPVSLANAAAVRAGVTVTVSTGDAGTAGTIASPAIDPWVIAAGATTTFRAYQQTGDGIIPLAKGYTSGQISALSSGGFAQRNARTADLVAPGDLNWALCSTNPALFQECTDYNGNPTPLLVFGGTSESAPLTAGAAALVIQAYRSTHGGASPSPQLVKRILKSTADDLGAPADEQGAGQLDTLAAVQMALSIQDEAGQPKPRGAGVIVEPAAVQADAHPGDVVVRSFEVTNTGSTRAHLEPSLQTLGKPFAGQTFTLPFDPATDPEFLNVIGGARADITRTFTVPRGTDHLDAAIAIQGGADQKAVGFGLLDPEGRQAAYSVPQGDGNYGHVDVVHPEAGKWTFVARTTLAPLGYTGPVQFTWAAEHFVSAGKVFPSSLDLPPGASALLFAETVAPDQPGDSAYAVRFAEGHAEIPFSLRTLVPVGARGSSFTGVLTGDNGRGAPPTQTYSFDVPAGVRDATVTVDVADPGYSLQGYLVDPHGQILGNDSNIDANGTPGGALSIFRVAPEAGRWRFVLAEPVASGNQTSIAFAARIAFDSVKVVATGLPDSAHTTLSAGGAPLTIPVKVTNTGAVAQAFFADARLATLADVELPQYACSATTTLPAFCGASFVPPESRRVRFLAQSTAPLSMDVIEDNGGPDLFGKVVATDTVSAAIAKPEVAYGIWVTLPALIGPFGPAGEPTEPVATAAIAHTQPFDPAVSADTGDYWADVTNLTETYAPLILAPGETGTITLTLTPDPSQVGTTITGFVYIDTQNEEDPIAIGDELARFPYAYTVTK